MTTPNTSRRQQNAIPSTESGIKWERFAFRLQSFTRGQKQRSGWNLSESLGGRGLRGRSLSLILRGEPSAVPNKLSLFTEKNRDGLCTFSF